MQNTISLGGALSAMVGFKVDYMGGPSYSWKHGRSIDHAKGNKTSNSSENNIMSAKKMLNLIGGVSDTGDMSAIGMEATKLQLSVGPNKNPSSKGWAAKFGPPMAGIAGVAAAVTAAVGAVVIHQGTTADRASSEDAYENYAGTVTGVTLGIEAAATILVMVGAAIAKESVTPMTHTDSGGDEPHGLIVVTNKGSVEMRGIKHVQLKIPDAMPQGKSNKGFALLSLQNKNEALLMTKDDDKTKSNLKMTLDNVWLTGGDKALVEALKTDLTLKAKGQVKIEAGTQITANGNLTVLK